MSRDLRSLQRNLKRAVTCTHLCAVRALDFHEEGNPAYAAHGGGGTNLEAGITPTNPLKPLENRGDTTSIQVDTGPNDIADGNFGTDVGKGTNREKCERKQRDTQSSCRPCIEVRAYPPPGAARTRLFYTIVTTEGGAYFC